MRSNTAWSRCRIAPRRNGENELPSFPTATRASRMETIFSVTSRIRRSAATTLIPAKRTLSVSTTRSQVRSIPRRCQTNGAGELIPLSHARCAGYRPSQPSVENLTQPAGKCLGLARVSGIFRRESPVVAREHDSPLPE